MRTTLCLQGLFVSDLGDRTFDMLARIYPEGRDRHTFRCQLPLDDPRLDSILACLTAAGRRPWQDKHRMIDQTSEFHVFMLREYDDSDLAGLPYLELRPERYEHAMGRGDDGLLRLGKRKRPRQAQFLQTLSGQCLVPERVKRILEQSGLRHILFRPTILGDEEGFDWEWPGFGEPWWELSSDASMPPLSPSLTLLDRHGQPLRERDFSQGCHLREGLYSYAELHYRAADLSVPAAADLAHTLEGFANHPDADDRRLVASRRFYEFCQQRGWRTSWVPVRVDEG